MIVKCRKCGQQIDRNTAYKVVVGNSNHYYCGKGEYELVLKEREAKNKVFALIDEIFGHHVINTAIFKEINEIVKVHNYVVIEDYLSSDKFYLTQCMHKEFSSEYAKIRYFAAIIKNKIGDHKTTQKIRNEAIKQSDFDLLDTNYTARPQRRGFIEAE